MAVEIRNAKGGQASKLAHLFYKHFEKNYDFLPESEGYILSCIGEYFDNIEDNGFWTVEENGEFKGGVSAVKKDENTAQIRLFFIDETLRGQGCGRKLMDKLMAFCRAKNYNHIILWTVDFCSEARKIYSKYGFKLTDTKINNQWANYPITEELWEINLME